MPSGPLAMPMLVPEVELALEPELVSALVVELEEPEPSPLSTEGVAFCANPAL